MEDEQRRAFGVIAAFLTILRDGAEPPRIWSRQWLTRRPVESVYYRLVRELSLEDPQTLNEWIRLDRRQYEYLLRLVTPFIQKIDTNMRKAVSAGERLMITLRYLATGESQRSLAMQFRVSRNLVCSIIPEVCRAIYEVLSPLYMKMPDSEGEWRQIAAAYNNTWDFPMCIGALDGKRVLLEKPANSGSDYYDYKGNFSMILMALVDADYKFIYVDVGAIGRASDGGVWDQCSLKSALEDDNNVINIPPEENLPISRERCPYVIVGDDAFPLKTNLMKPYAGREQTPERRIFNYRLSRARRTSENAFGILVARFQIFRTPIRTSPPNAKNIVLAAVALHNFLRVSSRDNYVTEDLLDREDVQNGRLQQGRWRQHPQGGIEFLQPLPPGNLARDAKAVRDSFKTYFNGVGRVRWQDRMVNLH